MPSIFVWTVHVPLRVCVVSPPPFFSITAAIAAVTAPTLPIRNVINRDPAAHPLSKRKDEIPIAVLGKVAGAGGALLACRPVRSPHPMVSWGSGWISILKGSDLGFYLFSLSYENRPWHGMV